MSAKTAFITMLAVSALATGFSLSTQAGVNLNIDIGIPPPELRYEEVPGPRDGFVWINGYWGWDGYRHTWVGGHWEPARRGYLYRPAHWDHDGDRWRLRQGYWEEHREEHRGKEWHEDRGEHRGHDHGNGHHDHDDR